MDGGINISGEVDTEGGNVYIVSGSATLFGIATIIYEGNYLEIFRVQGLINKTIRTEGKIIKTIRTEGKIIKTIRVKR